MPEKPDPNDKKQLPDENTWIYEAYTKLRSAILETIEPLDQYLATLNKYKTEFKLDPAKTIAQMDDDENPTDP